MTGVKSMNPDSPRRTWAVLFVAVCLSAFCAGVPSFGVGYVFGLLHSDDMRGDRDVERVRQILDADSARFGSLKINRGPGDRFLLEGTVSDQSDLEFLRDKLSREFGEYRAELILAVTVSGNSDNG